MMQVVGAICFDTNAWTLVMSLSDKHSAVISYGIWRFLTVIPVATVMMSTRIGRMEYVKRKTLRTSMGVGHFIAAIAMEITPMVTEYRRMAVALIQAANVMIGMIELGINLDAID
tara:strand:- start:81 stop:425 length:345 start_codon:yes stop_codon:yes gene_type:complete